MTAPTHPDVSRSPARRALLLLGAMLSGCPAGPMLTAADPVPVRVTRIRHGEILRHITLPATLRADQQTRLYARVPGYVLSIEVDRGDPVEPGDELARIEVPELQADLTRLQAEIRVAESEFRRLTEARSRAPDLVTPLSVDVASGTLGVARANMERAETLLAYARLKAPFAGFITERFVDVGAFVAPPSTPGLAESGALFTIADSRVIRVHAAVPELEAARIAAGIPVQVLVDGLERRSIQATISRHSHALDEATRTLRVEADLPNPDGTLRPGMYATIRIGVEGRENVLLAPKASIRREGRSHFVFRVESGRASKTRVQVGWDDGEQVEITEGIALGDHVVVPVDAALADQASVLVTEVQ